MGHPSKNLQNQLPKIQIFFKSSPQNTLLRTALLKDEQFIDAISEIILNILHCNLPSYSSNISAIKRNIKSLDALICKATSKQKKVALLESEKVRVFLKKLITTAFTQN